MPVQKPGHSDQDVATPMSFISAVKRKFSWLDDSWTDYDIDGVPHHHKVPFDFSYDLAADRNNTIVEDNFFTEEQDSLAQEWSKIPGYLWLNPPYGNIKPWLQKCVKEAKDGAEIFVLVPASTGSNWWRDYVHAKAFVYLLNGRITFVGHNTPYPKDLALLFYSRNNLMMDTPVYRIWSWKQEVTTTLGETL